MIFLPVIVAASAAVAPPAVDPAAAVETVIVNATNVPFAELQAAMQARLPGTTFLPYTLPSFDLAGDKPFAYADLAPTSDGETGLTVILSDGRSYARTFTADPEAPARSSATVLANMLTAIAEERADPVRKDAEIPQPKATEEPPKSKPVPVPVPVPDPKPEEPEEPATPPRRFELGLTPMTGLALTFGRDRPAEFIGGAGGLELAFRLPVGVLVVGGARYARRRTEDMFVHRIRAHLGAGYSARLRDFELAAIGAFAIEPFVVSADGTTPVTDERGARPGPLLGGFARLSPGFYLRPRRASNLALRVGTHVELGGSGLATGGIGRLAVFPADPEQPELELAHVGGFELAFGLDLTFWITVARDRT